MVNNLNAPLTRFQRITNKDWTENPTKIQQILNKNSTHNQKNSKSSTKIINKFSTNNQYKLKKIFPRIKQKINE